MIIDELIEIASAKSEGRKISDVRAGLGYTCVRLEDSSCGLAYTFRNDLGDCCGILGEAGCLIGRAGSEIMRWAGSGNLLKSAVGLAAVNAVLNDPKINWETGNVTAALDLRPSDCFGMVGEFRPILSEAKRKTQNIYVFEQNTEKDDGLYPEEDIPKYLPGCDVVIITSTSFINHTADEVLKYCKNARQVCFVGPSTPMCPQLMKNYGVSLLAGTVVTNPDLILQIVSQGGGTMSMKPAVRQVIARI